MKRCSCVYPQQYFILLDRVFLSTCHWTGNDSSTICLNTTLNLTLTFFSKEFIIAQLYYHVHVSVCVCCSAGHYLNLSELEIAKEGPLAQRPNDKLKLGELSSRGPWPPYVSWVSQALEQKTFRHSFNRTHNYIPTHIHAHSTLKLTSRRLLKLASENQVQPTTL